MNLYKTDPKTSYKMSKVKRENTKPEMVVRKCLRNMHVGYTKNVKGLPGTPDIVIGKGKRKKCIFVHGCFWHRHENCSKATTPKSNDEFWSRKFARNIERDREKITELEALGWDVLVIWECETKDLHTLTEKLAYFLS